MPSNRSRPEVGTMAVATSFAQAAGFGSTLVVFLALQIVSDRTGGVRMLALLVLVLISFSPSLSFDRTGWARTLATRHVVLILAAILQMGQMELQETDASTGAIWITLETSTESITTTWRISAPLDDQTFNASKS